MDTPTPSPGSFPRLTAWDHHCATGNWPDGCPDWALDFSRRYNPHVAALAVIEELRAAAATHEAMLEAARLRLAFDFNPNAVRVYRSPSALDAPHDGTPNSALAAAIDLLGQARRQTHQPGIPGITQPGGMLPGAAS